MARRFNKKAADKKVKSKHASKDKKKQQSSKKGAEKKKGTEVVAKYMYFAKHTLAPYPDEDGSALYVGDYEDEGALLDPAAVLRTRNSNNCEMLRRPGMGLSLSAASIDVGLKALKKLSALKKLKKAISSDEGEALRKACKTLNIGKNGKAKRSEVQKAVKIYANHMTKATDPEFHDALVGVASLSSKIYLAVMAMLEHRALFQKRKAWAKKMHAGDKQPDTMKAWTKEPGADDKLEAALVDAFMVKMKAQSRKGGGAKKESKSESEEEDSEELDSDEASSDEEEAEGSDDGKKADSSEEDGKDDRGKKDDSSEDEGDQDDGSSSSSSSAPKKKMKKASDSKKAKEDSKKTKKDKKKDDKVGSADKDGGSKKPEKAGGSTDASLKAKAKAAADGKAAKKAKKDSKATATDPIHYTSWELGAVQALAGQLMSLQAAIGVTPGGMCPTEEIRAWYEGIPEAVREAEAGMAAEVETALGDGDETSNLCARQAVASMLAVATKVEQWYESHTSAGASGSK